MEAFPIPERLRDRNLSGPIVTTTGAVTTSSGLRPPNGCAVKTALWRRETSLPLQQHFTTPPSLLTASRWPSRTWSAFGLPRTAQVCLVTLRVSSGSSASWGLGVRAITCLLGLWSKWLARLREKARISYCIVANRFLRESRALGQMPGYLALMRLSSYEKTTLQPARASKTSTLLAKYI